MSSLAFFTALTLLSVNPGVDIVKTARGYLGYPYVYGGSQAGFDCSSFVLTVFQEHGFTLPRTSRLQAQIGDDVDWQALAPGDLLFFSASPGGATVTHVAIATDDGHMVHAASGRGEVVIDPIDMPHFVARRIAAKRILNIPPDDLKKYANQGGSEHDGATPLTLGGGMRPGRWHHGPLDLGRGQSSVALITLAAVVDGQPLLLLSPHATLRVERWDLELAAQMPVAAALAPWQAAWNYAQATDWLRILNYFRVGTPNSRLYIEAGREVSASLGEGFLVANTTPAAVTGNLPNLPLHAPFAVAARVVSNKIDLQFVTDDVVAPAVIGGSVRYGPKKGTLAQDNGRLGISFGIDPTAPVAAVNGTLVPGNARIATALEGRLPLWQGENLSASADSALGLLATQGSPSFGGQVGTSLGYQQGPFHLSLRGGLRGHQASFVPGIFGVDYRFQRSHGPLGSPLWQSLDTQAPRQWRLGGMGQGELTLTRRYGLRVSYEGASRTNSSTGIAPLGAMEIGLLAREVFISSLRSWLSFYLTYHQRWVEGAFAPLLHQGAQELIFAGLRWRYGNYVESGLQLAKRVDMAALPAAASVWEGTLDISVSWPF